MTVLDLKPCPFCGSADVGIRTAGVEWAVVSCNECNGEGGSYLDPDSTSEEEAIEAWNRRAAAQPVTVEMLKRWADCMLDLDCYGEIRDTIMKIKETT